MTATYDAVLKANNQYAADFGDKGKLAMPPARRFAILTCMDARLDPAKYAGPAEGDAPRDPQCRRPRQRRRHSLAGDLAQAAWQRPCQRSRPGHSANRALIGPADLAL